MLNKVGNILWEHSWYSSKQSKPPVRRERERTAPRVVNSTEKKKPPPHTNLQPSLPESATHAATVWRSAERWHFSSSKTFVTDSTLKYGCTYITSAGTVGYLAGFEKTFEKWCIPTLPALSGITCCSIILLKDILLVAKFCVGGLVLSHFRSCWHCFGLPRILATAQHGALIAAANHRGPGVTSEVVDSLPTSLSSSGARAGISFCLRTLPLPSLGSATNTH